MTEAIGLLGLLGIIVFVFLCIIMPISAYCAQKWAYKCYKELRELNTAMKVLLDYTCDINKKTNEATN